jgi:small subunit ribosomal protein S2
VATVDTNCNPDGIDYIVPANDDAIKAIKVICSHIANAVLEGKMLAEAGQHKEPEAEEAEAETAAS